MSVTAIKKNLEGKIKTARIGFYGSFRCNVVATAMTLRERGLNIQLTPDAECDIIVVGEFGEVSPTHTAWLQKEYRNADVMLETYFLQHCEVPAESPEKLFLYAYAALLSGIADFTDCIQRHEVISVRRNPEGARYRILNRLDKVARRHPKVERDHYSFRVDQEHQVVEFTIVHNSDFLLRVPFAALALT